MQRIDNPVMAMPYRIGRLNLLPTGMHFWGKDMSAFLAEAMINPIRDVLRAPLEAGLCATFEVVGHDDFWVQVTRDAINMAYPLADDPHGRFATLAETPPCDGILAWEPMEFVTFSYSSSDPAVVTDRVEALFREIYACAGCSLVGRIESL